MEAARAAMQRAFNAHKSAAAKFESSVQAADETSTVTMTTVQLKNEICMIRKMECLCGWPALVVGVDTDSCLGMPTSVHTDFMPWHAHICHSDAVLVCEHLA